MRDYFGRRDVMIDPVATGKRIQKLRKERQLRVTDISDYMGFYEPQAVYKWMRGDSLPTLQNMFQLSQLFGTTIDDILICTATEQEMPRHLKGEKRDEDSSLFFLHFFRNQYL